jgi:hypothetical protein
MLSNLGIRYKLQGKDNFSEKKAVKKQKVLDKVFVQKRHFQQRVRTRTFFVYS